MDEEAAARAGAIAQQAPQPKKPYTVKTIQGTIKQFNATMKKLADGQLPAIEWTPEGVKGGKWEQPLPPEIYVPVFALSEYMGMIGNGESKYSYDPESLVSDTDLRGLQGTLKKMAKDKKLAEAFQEPIAGPPGAGEEEAGPAPSPGEFEEDDEMLAEGMG